MFSCKKKLLMVLYLAKVDLFSSFPSTQVSDPAFYALSMEPVFANIYTFGQCRYQDLHQLIMNNRTEENEEEIISLQEDTIYKFNKQSKIIVSLGHGYELHVYDCGKIKMKPAMNLV